MLKVERHPEGCVVTVRVQPGARREGVAGLHGATLKVTVTAPPEKGKANQAVLDLLARALGVKRRQLELISGAASRSKRVLVCGMSGPALVARLRQQGFETQ